MINYTEDVNNTHKVVRLAGVGKDEFRYFELAVSSVRVTTCITFHDDYTLQYYCYILQPEGGATLLDSIVYVSYPY